MGYHDGRVFPVNTISPRRSASNRGDWFVSGCNRGDWFVSGCIGGSVLAKDECAPSYGLVDCVAVTVLH